MLRVQNRRSSYSVLEHRSKGYGIHAWGANLSRARTAAHRHRISVLPVSAECPSDVNSQSIKSARSVSALALRRKYTLTR